MKRSKIIMNIVFIGLISISSCTEKNIEGTVVSLPVSFSLNEAMSGRIDKLNFSGKVIDVKLSDGKVVKAFATTEQMEQIFEGKNKVTLEKTSDETNEEIKWKVIKVEEKQEQQEQ